jgi:hypothetical protein
MGCVLVWDSVAEFSMQAATQHAWQLPLASAPLGCCRCVWVNAAVSPAPLNYSAAHTHILWQHKQGLISAPLAAPAAAHLSTTLLHLPVAVLQAKALQRFGCTGQVVGQARWGLQSPPWQVPPGPAGSSNSSSSGSSKAVTACISSKHKL